MADSKSENQVYSDFRRRLLDDRLQARSLIDELVRIDPAKYIDERIWYFAENKEFDLAKADIAALIEIDPAKGLFTSAQFNYQYGDQVIARSHLEAVIQLRMERFSNTAKDDEYYCRMMLAECYFLRAEWDEGLRQLESAAADYKLAASLDPALLTHRIKFCKKHGLEADLLDCLNERVKIHPFNLTDRAEYYERLENFDAALDDYSEAVRKSPVTNFKVYHSPLARAHLSRGKFLVRRAKYPAAALDFCLAFIIGVFFWLLIVPVCFIAGTIAYATLSFLSFFKKTLDKFGIASSR